MAKEPVVPVDAQKLIGTVLDGRYRIESVLGQGGMGMVFRAIQTSVQRPVAVKTLHPQLATAAAFYERFKREAEIASRLNHPNIITVFDFGRTSDGLCYYVMELLEGESLRQRIKREGPLTLRQTVAIIGEAAAGVQHAHRQNVIHRDLKPHNIMLATIDGQDYVKVLDFGLVKALEDEDEEQLTSTGQVLGTPQYMPPEQAGGEDVDQRSDLYAMTAVLYYCLTGRSPFGANSVRKALTAALAGVVPPIATHRKGAPVPASMDELVSKGLRPDKDARFQTVEEFIKALQSVVAGASESELDALPEFVAERSKSGSGNKKEGSGSSVSRRGQATDPRLKAVNALSKPIPKTATRSERISHRTPPPPPAPRRSGLVFGIVGVVVVVAIGLLVFANTGSTPTASATMDAGASIPAPSPVVRPTPPPSKDVQVTLHTTPDGAEVSEAGVTLGNTPLTMRWERGATRTFTFKAPGHRETSRSLRAETDQSFDLSLEPLPPPSQPRTPTRKPAQTPEPEIGAFE